MSYVTLDLTEVDALANDFRIWATSFEPRADMVVAKGGHDVAADAQRLAPVDTGLLKTTVSVDTGHLSFVAGPTAEHGLYQELGTSEMPPQPFLAPAFDRNLLRIEDALGQLGAQVLR